ncbi:MAG: DUF4878 domain-containing protein [Bacteroidetes bacterium]|nr:DUF4878 domain-containing protein [Bacteroidota bacterium]
MNHRTLFFSFVLGLSTLFFTSCSFFADKPSKNAEKFLTHFYAFEFEEAKQYGTKSTGELLDALKGFVAMLSEEDKKKKSFKILGETMDGETAVVTYQEDGSKEIETLNLVKEDGKWLVNMSKEDLNKEEEMEGGMDELEAEMEEEMPVSDTMPVAEEY